MAIDEPQPPYGLSYTSPGPPLFATPFITAANGQFLGNPFPLTFPSLNTGIKNPNTTQDFSHSRRMPGMTAPVPWNTYPYTENYFLSLERQFGRSTMLSVSYVGSQAHHLLLVYSSNPGNPALCLSLSQPSEVASGSPTCGPFGEETVYISASGQVYNGTRTGLGVELWQRRLRWHHRKLQLQFLEVTLRHHPELELPASGTPGANRSTRRPAFPIPATPIISPRPGPCRRSTSRKTSSPVINTNLPFDRLFGHDPRRDQRLAAFGNHQDQQRLSSDAAFRRRQLFDGQQSQRRE